MVTQSQWQVNDSPFLPETHRAIWRAWAKELNIALTWTHLESPFENAVSPSVGALLWAKRCLFLEASQAVKGLVVGFYFPLFQLSTEIEGPAASDCPSSLGEASILVVNPLHPDFAALAEQIKKLGIDYQALDGFHSPLIGLYTPHQDWAFDLRLFHHRPWLASTAPSSALWQAKASQFLSTAQLSPQTWQGDVAAGLIRPSLAWTEGSVVEVPALSILDGEMLHPERALSMEQRKYLQSGELRMRVLRHSRQVRFLEIQKVFAARPWRCWAAMGRAFISELYRYVRVKVTA